VNRSARHRRARISQVPAKAPRPPSSRRDHEPDRDRSTRARRGDEGQSACRWLLRRIRVAFRSFYQPFERSGSRTPVEHGTAPPKTRLRRTQTTAERHGQAARHEGQQPQNGSRPKQQRDYDVSLIAARCLEPRQRGLVRARRPRRGGHGRVSAVARCATMPGREQRAGEASCPKPHGVVRVQISPAGAHSSSSVPRGLPRPGALYGASTVTLDGMTPQASLAAPR
jgi:hypothetical protein